MNTTPFGPSRTVPHRGPVWVDESVKGKGAGISVPGDPDPSRLASAGDGGELGSTDDFLPLVYEELRRLAARRLARESREHTLQPTALVHEVWLRIVGTGDRTWRDRRHFLAAAAEAMRRILVDRARRRQAAKRGGHPERVALEDLHIVAPEEDDRLLAVNEVLDDFAALDPRKAELVKLRYFAGLSFEESAEALGIAVPTAKQWMAYARAWLKVEMRRRRGESAAPGPGGTSLNGSFSRS